MPKSMKQKQVRLADMTSDIVRQIMICVARSSDGAASIAKILSVCREFMELAEEVDILKVIVFHSLELSGMKESFWRRKSLFIRCLCHGNVTAIKKLKEYGCELIESAEKHRTALFEGAMDAIAKADALEIVNTRARSKALELALKECHKLADVHCEKLSKFVDLAHSINCLRNGI